MDVVVGRRNSFQQQNAHNQKVKLIKSSFSCCCCVWYISVFIAFFKERKRKRRNRKERREDIEGERARGTKEKDDTYLTGKLEKHLKGE